MSGGLDVASVQFDSEMPMVLLLGKIDLQWMGRPAGIIERVVAMQVGRPAFTVHADRALISAYRTDVVTAEWHECVTCAILPVLFDFSFISTLLPARCLATPFIVDILNIGNFVQVDEMSFTYLHE